jgi:hypothetical protein
MTGTPIKLFWGHAIPPGSSVHLDDGDDIYTILTNASLGIRSEDAQGSSTLRGRVDSVLIDKLIPNSTFDAIVTRETIFAVLTAGGTEQVQLNQSFSPLDRVELSVDGDFEVYVSGTRELVDEEGEGEEEEEELGEEDED